MFRVLARSATAVLALTAAGCIVPDDAQPVVTAGVDVASHFVHRGMVQNENGVVQPEASVFIPAKRDGTIIARAWANMDMSNDTGDAWLPDGHAGRFSEIDLNLLFAQRFDNGALVTGGFVKYALPNGLEFPIGERGETNEFLLEGIYPLSERFFSLQPSLELHYDFDEVDGWYVKAGVARSFDLSQRMGLSTRLGLGWMDGEQVFWHYGLPDGTRGLADATARVEATYRLRPGVDAKAFLAYSTIVDGELRDWFDLIGIEQDHVYGGLGISMQFGGISQ